MNLDLSPQIEESKEEEEAKEEDEEAKKDDEEAPLKGKSIS